MSQANFSPEKAPGISALESGLLNEGKDAEADGTDWDGKDDPDNPINWSSHKRWAHVTVVAVLCLICNMAPVMCEPGINSIIADFDVSSEMISTLAFTIYLLGLAFGPLFLSPLSEVYGRLPVYHTANLVFVALIIGNTLSKNVAQFMVLRFLSGCAGGMPLSLGGGTIADITQPAETGFATALFSIGPLAGPAIGPILGGFLAANMGWRWTFWLLAILGGAIGVAMLVVMRETSPKNILERKAARLRASTGNPHLRSKLARTVTPQQVLIQALIRPTMLLLRSPVVLVLSLYATLVFGIAYLLFTTFNDVFEGQYGFSQSESGLVYLGIGVATIVGVSLFSTLNPRIQAACMKADGVQKPRAEYRLVLMIWFSPCVAGGLFIYGWTSYYRVHWIVPIIGVFFMGLGAYFVQVPTQLYLIELFGSKAAASALSAYNLLRQIGGTFLPLAGPRLYKALGLGWGNMLLGLLALAFVLAPVLFYRYGERLRAKGAGTF